MKTILRFTLLAILAGCGGGGASDGHDAGPADWLGTYSLSWTLDEPDTAAACARAVPTNAAILDASAVRWTVTTDVNPSGFVDGTYDTQGDGSLLVNLQIGTAGYAFAIRDTTASGPPVASFAIVGRCDDIGGTWSVDGSTGTRQ